MIGLVAAVMSWEFAESLFDEYIPQPIKVRTFAPDPNVTVVSGIATQDMVFANSELIAELVSDESSTWPGSARRIALFGDQKYSPSLWNVLAHQSLLRLGQDYQTFLRRGALITPPVVVAPAIPKPKDPPSTPLIRKAIFKASRQSTLGSMLDLVSSDLEFSKAVEAVAGEMDERASEMRIPGFFLSVAPSSAAAPVANVLLALAWVESHSRDFVLGRCPALRKESAITLNKWFYRERLNKVVETARFFQSAMKKRGMFSVLFS
ncbi:hypothetical protein F4604DRAFT_2015743 [Suillus subluteus]|nr:hypothetical protein F4604DRAFT_2015743 [Suillus subluteus]